MIDEKHAANYAHQLFHNPFFESTGHFGFCAINAQPGKSTQLT
jgi:hypothetical protein